MTLPRSLLRARPADPLVRWMHDGTVVEQTLRDGDAVAWTASGRDGSQTWVTALGDTPSDVVSLVVEMTEISVIDGVTVPDAAFDLLPAGLRSPDPGHWCLWTRDPGPAAVSGAVDLELDDPRIAELLVHSRSAHAFPGHPRLVRWAGVVEGGRLLSVAGQLLEPSGAAHVVSVCTHPEARGRGMAHQACARIIDGATADGAPIIVLEMYADNEPGRRLYSALGFTAAGRYKSGLLRP